jgi:hypothetical protein
VESSCEFGNEPTGSANCRVASQLVATRVVLSSIKLEQICCLVAFERVLPQCVAGAWVHGFARLLLENCCGCVELCPGTSAGHNYPYGAEHHSRGHQL